MDKLISRQAAIDAVEKVGWYHINKRGELVKGANSKDHEPLYKAKDIYDALENVKPVQPKYGKWILNRSGAYCCSECMEPCASYAMMKPRDKFCKMCGAKMER